MRYLTAVLFVIVAGGCGAPPDLETFVGLWSSDRHSLSSFIELSVSKNGEFDCVEKVQVQTKPAPDLYRHGTWTVVAGKLQLKTKTLAALYDGVGYTARIEPSAGSADLRVGSGTETLVARWPLLGPPQPMAHDIKLTRTSKTPKPVDWAKLRETARAQHGRVIAEN